MISRNNIVAAVVIAAVAIVCRLSALNWFGENLLPSDGITYHNLAVNLSRGNGYSKEIEAPYYPSFFREPGYPLFLAGIYLFYTPFGQSTYLLDNADDVGNHPEIRAAQSVQALVGGITLVFFYLTLLAFLKPRIAFVISVLAAMYLPLAVFSTFILRETLQTCVVVCSNYLFMRYLLDRRGAWLIAFGIGMGLSALILKVTMLAPALAFIILWVSSKNFVYALKYSLMVLVIMLAVISPWLIRTYLFFPDWRIIRSMGTSFTWEVRSSYKAMEFEMVTGQIDSTTFARRYTEWKKMSEYERFNTSFVGEPEISEASSRPTIGQFLRIALERWRMGWIESLWVAVQDNGRYHMRPHAYYVKKGETAWFVFSLTGIAFGYVALIGLYVYYRRLSPILFAFIYFYSLFYIISNDPRRTLPVHLFVFLFSCLGFYYIYRRIVRRQDPNDIFIESTEVRSN